MRLSRWARGSYETDQDLADEGALLSTVVSVVAPGTDAEIIVVNSSRRVDAALLDQAPSCRLVVTTTSGMDHIDRLELARRNTAAARLPLARRDAVVEQSMCMALWGLQRRGALHAAAWDGRWSRAELPALGVRTLAGSIVGVVGCGVIGTRMVEILGRMGAEVLATDPAGIPSGAREADLEEMVRRADVLTLHCGLVEGSQGIVDASLLHIARADLVIVNTARGACVDLDAAVAALRTGRLGALCLDVFPEEPWPGLEELSRHDGALLTPHSAGVHRGLAKALREELRETVARFVEGRPLPFPVPASRERGGSAQAP